MLKNGSFEEGWVDIPADNTVNQRPNDWWLTWLAPGTKLWGSQDVAGAAPECVHKLADQLPPDERLGGENALILDGGTTYKIFCGDAAFGAQLFQAIEGLEPGSIACLTVPILLDAHGDGDPWSAEVWVGVNGEGYWTNRAVLGHRSWTVLSTETIVPESGMVEVMIRVKSKWARRKDFFMDALTLEGVPATGLPGPSPTPITIRVIVPAGTEVVVEEV